MLCRKKYLLLRFYNDVVDRADEELCEREDGFVVGLWAGEDLSINEGRHRGPTRRRSYCKRGVIAAWARISE